MKPTTLMAASILFVSGCGGAPAPVQVHPVRGKVTVAGKPAAGVKVYFYPTSAPVVPAIPSNPRAVTKDDGTFELRTYAATEESADGAAEGGYQVILLWPPASNPNREASDEDRLFGWYDAAHTKLTAEVKSGANQLQPFSLAAVNGPPPKSDGIPGRN